LYDGTTPIPKGQTSDPKPTSVLRNNLNGSLAALIQPQFCPFDSSVCDATEVTDWDDIDAFIRTVRAPRKPTGLVGALVAAGEALFHEAHCDGCHAGPGFTLSNVFYTPGPAANGTLPYAKPSVTSANALSAMLGSLRTQQYAARNILGNL